MYISLSLSSDDNTSKGLQRDVVGFPSDSRVMALQSIHNGLEVIVRILMGHIPLRLLGIHHFVVLHRHRLDVTLPQVES